MIRLIFWGLLLYFAYRVFFASRKKEIRVDKKDKVGDKSAKDARKDFLNNEGEYVDYEEVD